MTFDSLWHALGRGTRDKFDEMRGRVLPDVPEPLHLRRGGFVAIDPTPFRMLADRANFSASPIQQPIAARGLVDLNGSYLHRYYLDDDATWLQIKTDGGMDDAHISECLVWQYWDTKTPANRDELKFIAGPNSLIGLPTYQVGAYTYQRVWGVAPGNTELIPLTERVYTDSDSVPKYSCAHLSMLYRRSMTGTDRQEYVLISVEECPDSLQVVTSIGIDLLQADLTIT
jgi:hypothetical protein